MVMHIGSVLLNVTVQDAICVVSKKKMSGYCSYRTNSGIYKQTEIIGS